MQIVWHKAYARPAYRDTRRLQRSTWLPKAPKAHVSSSLHPTLGLCILTKHLAVSAPVHHSRDPTHTSLFSPLCLYLHPEESVCITHCESWRFSIWVSIAHAYSFGFNHQAVAEIAGLLVLGINACRCAPTNTKMFTCWNETTYWSTTIKQPLSACTALTLRLSHHNQVKLCLNVSSSFLHLHLNQGF